MRILGIDPGIDGACALYCSGATVVTVPNGIFDLPTVGEKSQRELNYAALRDSIWLLKPDVVFLERATAMPSIPDKKTGERRDMGATSAFKYGGGYFSIKAVVACLGLPLRVVTSVKWKNSFGLKGGDGGKEAARLMAIQRYPMIAPFLKFKLNHQRAEAFLIAVYGASLMDQQRERRTDQTDTTGTDDADY